MQTFPALSSLATPKKLSKFPSWTESSAIFTPDEQNKAICQEDFFFRRLEKPLCLWSHFRCLHSSELLFPAFPFFFLLRRLHGYWSKNLGQPKKNFNLSALIHDNVNLEYTHLFLHVKAYLLCLDMIYHCELRAVPPLGTHCCDIHIPRLVPLYFHPNSWNSETPCPLVALHVFLHWQVT